MLVIYDLELRSAIQIPTFQLTHASPTPVSNVATRKLFEASIGDEVFAAIIAN